MEKICYPLSMIILFLGLSSCFNRKNESDHKYDSAIAKIQTITQAEKINIEEGVRIGKEKDEFFLKIKIYKSSLLKNDSLYIEPMVCNSALILYMDLLKKNPDKVKNLELIEVEIDRTNISKVLNFKGSYSIKELESVVGFSEIFNKICLIIKSKEFPLIKDFLDEESFDSGFVEKFEQLNDKHEVEFGDLSDCSISGFEFLFLDTDKYMKFYGTFEHERGEIPFEYFVNMKTNKLVQLNY